MPIQGPAVRRHKVGEVGREYAGKITYTKDMTVSGVIPASHALCENLQKLFQETLGDLEDVKIVLEISNYLDWECLCRETGRVPESESVVVVDQVYARLVPECSKNTYRWRARITVRDSAHLIKAGARE
jgi:hypothetical protein